MNQKRTGNEATTEEEFINRFRTILRILKGLIMIGLGLSVLFRVLHL